MNSFTCSRWSYTNSTKGCFILKADLPSRVQISCGVRKRNLNFFDKKILKRDSKRTGSEMMRPVQS
jgi:hypothetical protein